MHKMDWFLMDQSILYKSTKGGFYVTPFSEL